MQPARGEMAGPAVPGLLRFAPASLCRLLAEHGPWKGSISLECAVLFADISGFTAMAARMAEGGVVGTEELISRHLNHCFGEMLRLVHTHGGEVEKFAGDALLATFRAPDHDLGAAVGRARGCALAVAQSLHGMQTGGQALRVHAGVACGALQCHDLALGPGARVFVMTGEPLAQMADAVAAAPPGEVRLTAHAESLRAASAATETAAAAPSAAARAHPALEDARVAPYVNAALRERLALADDVAWLAELRRVSSVFVSFGEFAGDASQLATCAALLGAQVARFDGLLHDLLVDDKGLVGIVLFGVRQSHEDDAARALRFAIGLHQSLAQAGFAGAAGVATGRVYCGVVGDARRSELAVIGETMNLAARLMHAAGDGVLCAPSTAADAARVFAFEPVPGLALKGIAAEFVAQRPLGAHEARASVKPAAGPTLVGRDAERSQLAAALQAHRSGRGFGALVLEGEAGIGKSALADAAVAQAQALDMAVVALRGDALEQATPYFAWRDATARLLGVDRRAAAAEQLEQLQAALARLPEGAAAGPLLSAVLPVAPPETDDTRTLAAMARSERLRDLLLNLSIDAATRRPLMLFVEDAHWLDSASWSLLQSLATRGVGVMVLLTTRPLPADAAAPLEAFVRAAQVRRVALGPLTRQAAAELVCAKLGAQSLSDGVDELVFARAGGHPYFTEELALALRDGALVRVHGGICTLAASGRHADELALPDTLERVLTSRIDLLDEGARMLLKVASVLGRDFDPRLLARIYPLQTELAQLPARVQDLCRLELLWPLDDGQVQFKHAITRDVSYSLLPFSLRWQLHRAVAEALEDDAGAAALSSPLLAPVLAHHWARAEQADKACAAAEAAGAQALARFANREAVHFLREALHWNARRAQPFDDSKIAQWEASLGQAYRVTGELEASAQTLDSAIHRLRRPVPRKTALARLQLVSAMLGALLLRRPRVPESGVAPNAANTVIEAYAVRGHLAHYANDTEGLMFCHSQSCRAARHAASSVPMIAAYGSMAHLASYVRLFGTMRRYMDATQAVADRIGTPLAAGTAAQFLGHLTAGLGELDRALREMERAAEAYVLVDRGRLWEEALTNLGFMTLMRGDPQRSFELFEQMERSARSRDDLQTTSWALCGMARARLFQGRLDEAMQRYARAEPTLQETLTSCEMHGMRSLAQARLGDAGAALRDATRAIEQMEKAPATSYTSLPAYGATMEACVMLAHGGPTETRAEAAALAQRMFKVYLKVSGLFPLIATQTAVWRGAMAELSQGPAAALRHWKKAVALAERSQWPADRASAWRWLARAQQGAERADSLMRAAAAYDRLGMAFEANQACVEGR